MSETELTAVLGTQTPVARQTPEVFMARMAGADQVFPAPSHQSLFASMTQAGAAWPVSCRNGTCRTCLARLTEGKVMYDIPWPGLSTDEKQEGYCLPCVARPACDLVIDLP